MATISFRDRSLLAAPTTPAPLHIFLWVGLSFAAVVWISIVVTGEQAQEVEQYLIVLGIYGLASVMFLTSRIKAGKHHFFDLPVFLTIVFLLRFGIAPLRVFIDPSQPLLTRHEGPEALVQGLFYFSLGAAGFWLGSGILRYRPASLTSEDSSSQVSGGFAPFAWAVGFFLVAQGARVYMLHSNLYSYTASEQAYFSRLALVQVLGILDMLGTIALVAISIERFKHPYDSIRRFAFVLILVTECGWGLISGMKSVLLQNFILVALVSSLVERKLRLRLILTATLILIALYPISDSYRGVIRGRGSIQVMGFESAAKANEIAVARAGQSTNSVSDWLQTGLRNTVARLDLLQSLAAVVNLGPTQMEKIKGDEKLWMIPFYPFVPRFVWRTKPVLDKGKRFSEVLGLGRTTSTAITYPGDLYVLFGIPGTLVGMFLWGLAAEKFTMLYSHGDDKRRTFIYVGIFLSLISMEIDVFSFLAGLVRTFLIVNTLAWIVYGRQRKTVSRNNVTAGVTFHPA